MRLSYWILPILMCLGAAGAPAQPPPSITEVAHAALRAQHAAVAQSGWWAAQQRSFPATDVPEGAQLRALRQIEAARVRQSATGGGAGIQGDRWINVGPAPIVDLFRMLFSGRVIAIAVDPRDAGHWLIGAAQGGVWESRDAGTSWTPKTDDQASLAIGALTFAPSNSSIIYAGTGEPHFREVSYAGQGLLKSTDGGATWALLAAPTFARTSFSDVKVDPADANIVIAATMRGTAGRANDPNLPLPSAPPTGVFKSVDGGVTWARRLDGTATDLEVDGASFNRQYVGIGEMFGAPANGAYRSTDAGETWSLVDGPWSTMSGGVGRIELALAPSNSNVLYVSIQDALDDRGPEDGGLLGLFRTDNAWDPVPLWRRIPVEATDDGSGIHGYCGWDPVLNEDDPRCWYNHDVLVDRTNPDILYAAGNPLWKFDGTNWTEISKLIPLSRKSIHADQHSLAWAGDRLIVGNDGGVFSTTNDGATWSNHNRGLSISQFYKGSLHPTNPNFALGGTQDTGFEKWSGADIWDFVYFFDGMDHAISTRQPDTHWAIAGQNLLVYRTREAPQGFPTFFAAEDGLDKTGAPFAARLEKCPANDDVLIGGTDNLWKTTNFFSADAPSWAANGPEMGACVRFQTSAGCITALAFAAADSTCSTYVFATGDGRLRRTTDGGSSWSDIDASNTVPDRSVTDLEFDPHDAETLYATLSGFDTTTPGHPGHVFKTTNALAAAPAWSDVSPSADLPENTIAIDPVDSRILYLGADIGVWKSTDGGDTWTHFGPEAGMPNVAVFDLEIHPTARRAFAFTHGRGLLVVGCRSAADCSDGDASNGVEVCDTESGRCGSAPEPTATSTASVSPSPTRTAGDPTASPTPSVAPAGTASATPSTTATALPTASRTAPSTATVSPPVTSTPMAHDDSDAGGCSVSAQRAADGGTNWVLLMVGPLLLSRRWRRRIAAEN